MFKFFLGILALTSGVSSSLLLEELEGTNCTVTSYEDVYSASQECETLVLKDIIVPAGQSLQIDLLPEATLVFQGSIEWEFFEWEGPLMHITGDKVEVIGDNAVLDGQGAKWWDGSRDKGRAKPKLLRISTTGGSVFQNINIINCPRHCVSINSASDTILDNFLIDVSDGDSIKVSLGTVNDMNRDLMTLVGSPHEWCFIVRYITDVRIGVFAWGFYVVRL